MQMNYDSARATGMAAYLMILNSSGYKQVISTIHSHPRMMVYGHRAEGVPVSLRARKKFETHHTHPHQFIKANLGRLLNVYNHTIISL
jgi:hypothetical protein